MFIYTLHVVDKHRHLRFVGLHQIYGPIALTCNVLDAVTLLDGRDGSGVMTDP